LSKRLDLKPLNSGSYPEVVLGVVVDDVVAVSAGRMILGQPLLVRGVSTNQ